MKDLEERKRKMEQVATVFRKPNLVHAIGFAERIGINPTLFSQYMSGNKIPSLKRLEFFKEEINKLGRELEAIKIK